MRSFRHWTLRYIVDRVSQMIYQKRHPEHPWLTKSANYILSSYLRPSDIGLECGAGKSTLWFAQCTSFLTSIEHNQHWYNRVLKKLKERKLSNVDLLLIETKDQYDDEDSGQVAAYIHAVERFKKESLDFVLVDGIYRDACANAVLDKIRPGGVLIIDNANWFLPCDSRSPTSRTAGQGPASPQWAEFLTAMKRWRCIWTSNGVFDTVLYIKP